VVNPNFDESLFTTPQVEAAANKPTPPKAK